MPDSTPDQWPVDIAADYEALGYPGVPLEFAGLLRDARFAVMSPRAGEPLGASWISADDADLDEVLRREGAAAMSARTLVVAVGSNASASVMLRKLVGRGASAVLPFAPCVVGNLAVGHSAHVSTRGSIAATPYDCPGARTALVASWLDDAQLAAIDATEPTYWRTRLDAADYPIEILGAGESPDQFSVYESKAGVLALQGALIPLSSQEALHAVLAPGEPRFAGIALHTISGFAADEALRMALRDAWAADLSGGSADRSGGSADRSGGSADRSGGSADRGVAVASGLRGVRH
jgi:hypothetical protein